MILEYIGALSFVMVLVVIGVLAYMFNTELRNLRQEIDMLHLKEQSNQAEINTLKVQLANRDETIRTLKEELETLRRRHNDLQQKYENGRRRF